jgi:hypothetical protein
MEIGLLGPSITCYLCNQILPLEKKLPKITSLLTGQPMRVSDYGNGVVGRHGKLGK